MTAGITLNHKVGDYVEKKEILATLYTNDISKIEVARRMVEEAIVIVDEPVEKTKMILEIL